MNQEQELTVSELAGSDGSVIRILKRYSKFTSVYLKL